VRPLPYTPKRGASPITKNYLRAISAVDEGIGAIYKLLEEKGILENTCIVFAGDNGYLLGEHRRGDKRAAYNESMRIPWVMRMPGVIPAGSQVDELVLNIDLAPTLLDLAGVKAPAIMQGKSVLPLFAAKKPDWRDSFLFTYWRDLVPNIPRIVSVRTDRYIYSTYPDLDDIDELYDLKNDPYEMKNLAESPEHKALLNEMKAKMAADKKAYGYKEFVPRPRPEPDWGVEEGLLCDLSFNRKDRLKLKDASPIAGKPKLTGGTLVRGLKGSALKFDPDTSISLPWNQDITPNKGSYIIETLVRPSADGVIAAQGNGNAGVMLYVEKGRPGFVVNSHGGRRVFLDEESSYTGEWVHLLAQIKNYHNRIALWVNGELVADELMMWPLRSFAKTQGPMTLGRDPSGNIDPLEISPLRFTGEMEYFRIYRNADIEAIVAKSPRFSDLK